MIYAPTTAVVRYLLVGLHGIAASLALAISVIWPVPGNAAMLVPLGLTGRTQAFVWMSQHDARLLATEAAGERLIVSIPTSLSALSALAHGYLPVAAQAASCEPPASRLTIPERSRP
jgi:hypothetical protein